MTAAASRPVEPLPRGVLTSTLVGASAAACAWIAVTQLQTLTLSYARLDQLAALVIGGMTGAAVTASRESRQRRNALAGAAGGALLGGVGALAGASLLAFGHAAVSPAIFLIERAAAWLLTGIGATVGSLVYLGGLRRRALLSSILIAAAGGAIAGLLDTLPGATEVWQGVAMLWFGGTVGLAVAGPELWHACAVLVLLPPKGRTWNPLRMREWPVHEGFNLAIGEARLACRDGRIALYPPSGGMTADGRTTRRPRYLASSTRLGVGRQRYHVTLLRTP